MRSAGLAIGWGIWRRHRRGLCALAAAFVAAAIAIAAIQTLLDPESAIHFCALAWAPLAIGALYVPAVFAYGFDSDLAAAGSCSRTARQVRTMYAVSRLKRVPFTGPLSVPRLADS